MELSSQIGLIDIKEPWGLENEAVQPSLSSRHSAIFQGRARARRQTYDFGIYNCNASFAVGYRVFTIL
jgi:hypothetical protein